jgi:transposase
MAAPSTKVVVRLTADQRQALEDLVHTGAHPAHAARRARILLKADADGPDAWTDERIAQALDINRMTVSRTRQQFAEEGLDAVLHKQKAAGRQYRKLDGAQEARLVALACSQPPAGQARWTMRLLADRLVELEVVEAIDASTVWRALQKTNSSPGSSSSGSSRPGPAGRSSPRWRT